MATAPRIFLSYRRADAAGHAGRLYDALVQRFGEGPVFMDTDAIAPGVDFDEVIRREIARASVVLVVIGRGWLEAADAGGARRLEDPADLVRVEVELALAAPGRVIPVLVQGAVMPAAADLPEPVAALARINAIELTDARWAYDTSRLVGLIAGDQDTQHGTRPAAGGPDPLSGREPSGDELRELLAAEASGIAFLALRDADDRLVLCALAEGAGRLTVGRRAGVDVPVTWDERVSGLHAELECVGGEWVVIDDELSRNGTFVNGVRVTGRQRVRDGDRIRVGRTVMALNLPGAEGVDLTAVATDV